MFMTFDSLHVDHESVISSRLRVKQSVVCESGAQIRVD